MCRLVFLAIGDGDLPVVDVSPLRITPSRARV